MTLISVIIPTYNSGTERLKRSIESVLNQTHVGLEVIVVDDGSHVPFGGVDKSFSDSRINWVAMGRNKGVAAARNVGIQNAQGKYIAFLDAGDWWENEKLEKQINLPKSTDVGWVYCGAIGHTPEGQEVPLRPHFRGQVYRPLLRSQVITGSCSAVMVKKSLVEKVGGFCDQEDLHEDWDLWIRLSKLSAVDYVPQALVHLRAYDDRSRSKQLEAYAQRKETFLKKYEAELENEGLLKHAWARHHQIMGRRYLMQEQPFKAFANWAKVLSLEPRMFPFQWIPIAVLSIAYRPLFRKIVMWRLCRLK